MIHNKEKKQSIKTILEATQMLGDENAEIDFVVAFCVFNNFSGGMRYIKKKKIEIKLLEIITTVSDMDNTGTAD